nr:J437 [uncultured bacterium]
MADVPPLPPGARLTSAKPDPWEVLQAEGFRPTSGFRTPGDVERIRAQGYNPATNGPHNRGDGVDLTHPKLSPKAQAARLDALSKQYGWGATIVDEGHHRHLAIPGWGAAPGTPGTKNFGLPPLPPGATLVQRGSLAAAVAQTQGGKRQAGGARERPTTASILGQPTGKVVDGDTFGLTSGRNARLFGVDAFELRQQGQAPGGSLVPLGPQSRGALSPFVTPDSTVRGMGKQTYGRPVVTLDKGGDAGLSLLQGGNALATPSFLQGNALLSPYMEAERLARLNRRGAFGTNFQTPESYRAGNPDPWEAPEQSADGKGAAYFWDDPTPQQGLRPEIAEGYLAIWNDPQSTPDDLLAYAEANGFKVDPATVAKSYASRFKGGDQPDSAVGYIAPPRVLTDPGDGRVGVTARGFADPINMLDEMGAVADSVGLTGGRENVFGSDRRFGDILANNLDQNRSILAHDAATHPNFRLGGQLASAVALPYGAGARTPAALARLGAIEGGLAGFGAGEGSVGERIPTAIGGAALGAGGGVVLGHLAPPALDLASRGASAVRSRLGRAPAAVQPSGGVVSRPDQGVPSAAMRTEDGPGQVLFGPVLRQPDRIDVGGLPPFPSGARLLDPGDIGLTRPLGEPLGADEVARLFRDADPSAVLPRPGNVVTSLEEAEIANPSRFQPIQAPDELDELAIRRLRSPKDLYKSRSVRGPLDMTQWLRRSGGIQDQGGNLKHLGIDGTPRKLPFGGSEAFHGKLINNETGMTLDEATHALWEAGYFGHHAERPMIDDLLQALHAENIGAQRYFHPDDLEEVSRFEAAQSDRYRIEEAAAAGRPLHDELGETINLDDLIANTPPASSYEDMPSLVGKVGNINLGKLERPQDVAQLLDHVSKRVGGFDAAARGRITNEETARLASDLNMTPEQLLKRRPGQALNAEQAFAARTILRGTLEQVGKLARKAVGGSDADKLAFRKALMRHAAIQEQVAGATAESGRALQQMKMTAGLEKAQAKAIREYLRGGEGDSIEDAASMIVDLMEDPAKANHFIQNASKPGVKGKLVELYYNSLLSGPQTHAVNIVSNAMTAALSIPEHVVASIIGQVRRGASQAARLRGVSASRSGVKFRLAAEQEVDRVLGSEIGQRIVGLMQGAVDGLGAARYTFKTGKVPDFVTKVESIQQEAIGGRVGHVLRTPTRALAAEDEFFKAVARRSELASLATRQARAEGLNGKAAKDRIDALMRLPTAEMMERANDFARYQTFQRPVGDIAGGLMRAANNHPWLKLVVPFIRTPTNIVKYAAERSPVAPMLKDWRADFMAGGARRDLAIARSTMGTGLAMVVADAASKGLITGGGPLDENARGILRADGWQPYSIKVGDEWISYQRLDPLAMTLGVAADYVEKQSAMTERQKDDLAMLMVASMIQNLSDKTWLSGLSDALGAIQDPVRYGPGAIRRTAAGIAVPAAVGQVARTVDESPREQKTIGEAIQARIPGLSDNLRPSLDAWGQPIEHDGRLGPDIASPFPVSTREHEPINEEAMRLGLKVTHPSRTAGGQRLSDEQFHAYKQLAGGLTASAFNQLIASPQWRTLTPDQQRKAYDKIKRESRKAARKEMGLSAGDAGDEPAALPPPPKGVALPPLPPGARMIGQ